MTRRTRKHTRESVEAFARSTIESLRHDREALELVVDAIELLARRSSSRTNFHLD